MKSAGRSSGHVQRHTITMYRHAAFPPTSNGSDFSPIGVFLHVRINERSAGRLRHRPPVGPRHGRQPAPERLGTLERLPRTVAGPHGAEPARPPDRELVAGTRTRHRPFTQGTGHSLVSPAFRSIVPVGICPGHLECRAAQHAAGPRRPGSANDLPRDPGLRRDPVAQGRQRSD